MRLIAIFVAFLLGGCETVGYYLQSAGGQLDLMARARPIPEVLDDPESAPFTQAQLRLVQRIRRFAVTQLDLPDNGSYRSYADVQREALVWSVVAAPALSLEPYQWCYPVIGCANYRGYFQSSDARVMANRLGHQGWDVAVEPVPAYSTLGWFADPLPSTVVDWPEPELAGLIFHELAHQKVYAADDSAFNESYATLVEQEGVGRWLKENGSVETIARWKRQRERKKAFAALVTNTRGELAKLYASDAEEHDKLSGKAKLFDALRHDYRELKKQWNGSSAYDRWFARDLNNAHLASFQTYAKWVPALRQLLHEAGGKMLVFHERCEALASLSLEQRQGALQRLQRRAYRLSE